MPGVTGWWAKVHVFRTSFDTNAFLFNVFVLFTQGPLPQKVKRITDHIGMQATPLPPVAPFMLHFNPIAANIPVAPLSRIWSSETFLKRIWRVMEDLALWKVFRMDVESY